MTFETISCSYSPAKVLVRCGRNMKWYLLYIVLEGTEVLVCTTKYRSVCVSEELICASMSKQGEEAMVNYIQGIAV